MKLPESEQQFPVYVTDWERALQDLEQYYRKRERGDSPLPELASRLDTSGSFLWEVNDGRVSPGTFLANKIIELWKKVCTESVIHVGITTILVINSKHELLLVKPYPRDEEWRLPADCIRQGETPVSAAQKAIFKQVSCSLYLQKIVGIFTDPKAINFVFTGQILNNQPFMPNRKIIDDAKYFSLKDNHGGFPSLVRDKKLHEPQRTLDLINAWSGRCVYPIEILK